MQDPTLPSTASSDSPAPPANIRGLAVGVVLLLCLAGLGGVLSLVFTSFLGTAAPIGVPGAPPTTEPEPPSGLLGGALGTAIYMPPRPQEAPASIRDAVMLGYRLMNQTDVLLPANVGNRLTCSSCHFDGGLTEGGRKGGLSLVGVAAKYPVYRAREHGATDLVTRTNSCFERSMNGAALDPSSPEMTALIAYYHWISRGVPIYAEIPWLGIRDLESDHRGDAAAGERVYAESCAKCHGEAGEGTLIAPPLWGDHSFNSGAGMHVPRTLAAFTYLNMPKGNPDLTVEQAIDVAAYVASQPRPRFAASSPDAAGPSAAASDPRNNPLAAPLP